MTAPDPAASPDEPRRFTSTDVAEAAGVTPAEARRYFHALGFPDTGDQIGYTDSDVRSLVDLKLAMERAGLDLATGFRLARAVGQNVARLSDWQVAALASQADGSPGGTAALAREVGGTLQDVLVYAWQRHLGAAVSRLDPDPAAVEEVSVSVTVGFADLVAFSALSNELDTHRLGELVEIFESRCADVVAAHEGRMIKTLGDSVLFVSEDADRALDIASGLVEVIGEDPRLPDVSVGLATGLVVTRLGDVFGPPVNLAARLTALARRNRVLVDPATVEVLTEGRYDLLRLTARPLRGFGLVEPVAVRLR